MTYANIGEESLDYFPCQYGSSRLLFRGPRRRLSGDYVAFLGGIETYGKYIELPFPTLTEHETSVKSVNLGCANVGVDAYLTDAALVSICRDAKATVIQIMGAQNMSNRFYAVHPRRNDRFLRASSLLTSLYSDVDFTEYSFTRHLLSSLAKADSAKFQVVEKELKDAWVARMNALIEQIGGKVILLWLADHKPGEGPYDTEPMLIDRVMVDRVSEKACGRVEVIATPEERQEGLHEMVFGPMELPAAEEMLGPILHQRAARYLAPEIQRVIA